MSKVIATEDKVPTVHDPIQQSFLGAALELKPHEELRHDHYGHALAAPSARGDRVGERDLVMKVAYQVISNCWRALLRVHVFAAVEDADNWIATRLYVPEARLARDTTAGAVAWASSADRGRTAAARATVLQTNSAVQDGLRGHIGAVHRDLRLGLRCRGGHVAETGLVQPINRGRGTRRGERINSLITMDAGHDKVGASIASAAFLGTVVVTRCTCKSRSVTASAAIHLANLTHEMKPFHAASALHGSVLVATFTDNSFAPGA